jgi:hypothetical protein
MKNKIEKMISKDLQSSYGVIQSEGNHQERAIAACIFDQATSQLGV